MAGLLTLRQAATLIRMTTTLNQSQADLPRLVELASQGEDVVITVDGLPKARLTKAEAPTSRSLSAAEMQAWVSELQQLRAQCWTGTFGPSAEELLAEDRDGR